MNTMSEKENEKILNFPSIARKNAAKTEENPFIAAIKAATEGIRGFRGDCSW
jgi:hypothetical protein